VFYVFTLGQEEPPFFQMPIAASTKKYNTAFRVHASGERSKLLTYSCP